MNTEPSHAEVLARDEGLSAGATLGRWVLLRELGRGATATVFEARHADLGRVAALKVLHHGARFSAEARQRFLREGRAAASLAHPNAVVVFDVAIHEGAPYLVMERVAGETLASLLAREGPLTVPRARALLLPICAAVAAAHRAGIVHRDIKPSNITLAQSADGAPRPVLLDFGAARLLVERDGDITRTQAVLGTPAYMAPEQALAARAATPACDQFSLAAVFLEMVSGALPYPGARWTECFAAAVRGEVQDVAKVAPHLPPAIARTLRRALHPDPARRFACVDEFARGLASAPLGTGRSWVAPVAIGVVATVATAVFVRPRPSPVAPPAPRAPVAQAAPRAPPPPRSVALLPVLTVDAGAPAAAHRSHRRRARAVADAGAAPPMALGPNEAPILSH